MTSGLPPRPRLKVFLEPGAIAPVYSSAGAMAMDFHHYCIEKLSFGLHHDYMKINTGVRVEIPQDWGLVLAPRSGLGANEKITLSNSVAMIDSDYRGIIYVTLERPRGESGPPLSQRFSQGDRICQGALIYCPRAEIEVVSDLSELSQTARGTGGHGSTGV